MALAENGEYGKIPEYLCEMILEMKKIAAEQNLWQIEMPGDKETIN